MKTVTRIDRFMAIVLLAGAMSAIVAGCALLGPGPIDGRSPTPLVSPGPEASLLSISVETRDLLFDPSTLTLAASGTSRILVRNAGRVVHNLTIDALDVQAVVSPGGTGETTIVRPVPGVYEFYCSVSGHREAGMVGTLTVR